jgi:hypothetical protein
LDARTDLRGRGAEVRLRPGAIAAELGRTKVEVVGVRGVVVVGEAVVGGWSRGSSGAGTRGASIHA